MKIIKWIRNQPVASYYLMVFLIAWGGSILGIGSKFLRNEILGLQDVIPAGIAMIGAPCFVGFTLTYICDGRPGMRDLWARMKKWKVPLRWYAVALIFPLLILIVQIPLSILVAPELKPIFFRIGILMGLIAGFFEEIGWTGFVYPKMRLRYSVLRASIYLGLIHALWHAAADFLGNFNIFEETWLPYFVAFFVFVVALRVIIAWVYENTGSVLLAQVIHASSSGFLGILVTREYAAETWYIFYAFYAVAIWLVAAVIVLRNERRFISQPA
jgi:membrane protease YdiL (CAAX protease family)